jgi:hypothetical protein
MRRTALLPPTAAVIVLAACSASTTDFKKEGEKFLESDEVAENVGYSFTDADCEEPANTDEGTTYRCTAVDNEGDTWEFTVEITGDNELTVVDGSVVG